MPAWTTSLLRELVAVPIADSASSRMVSWPAIAQALATASPTTPAPTTTQSTSSTPPPLRLPALMLPTGPLRCQLPDLRPPAADGGGHQDRGPERTDGLTDPRVMDARLTNRTQGINNLSNDRQIIVPLFSLGPLH